MTIDIQVPSSRFFCRRCAGRLPRSLHSDGRNATSPYLCFVGDNLTCPCYVGKKSRPARKNYAWIKPSRRLAGCRGRAPSRAPTCIRRAQEWVNLRRRRKEGEPSRRLQSLWGSPRKKIRVGFSLKSPRGLFVALVRHVRESGHPCRNCGERALCSFIVIARKRAVFALRAELLSFLPKRAHTSFTD